MKFITKVFTILGLFSIIILMAVLNQQSEVSNTPNTVASLVPPIYKENILKGFRNGEVAILYPYFDELISICIDGEEAIYLAYNAQAALQNFFNNYPPKKFDLNHTSKNNDRKETYFIGDYTDKNNNNLHIYIFLEAKLIQNIEIRNNPVSS